MDFMPLIPFLGVSVPESLILYYMVLVLTGKKESPLFVIVLSLLTSLFSFTVRSIPILFGIHSILQVIIMIFFLNLFFQLSWHTAAIVMIIASIALGLAEGVFVPFIAWAFSLNLQQVVSDPLLRILFTLPHLAFLGVFKTLGMADCVKTPENG
ncbi:hypothetical protein [Petroclostridium sp. X23]|uniref:hypothetical protein n=1 Tax=Petroclostridium sp. X23 TaxID=3045146 RepID=UPI0024AD64F5|nr:hypothetical protein [Petroclostridium sp. X23]WHH61126.1 hypothetical protein QKW49_10635 [Petroclostridium sp. X23]